MNTAMNIVIKKIIRAMFLFLCVLLPWFSMAALIDASNSLLLEETVSEDAYLLSEKFDFNGNLEWDLFYAWGEVELNGDIQEDVNMIVWEADINTNIGDDLRIIAWDVTINKEVKGDLFVLGGEVFLTNKSVIHGDVYLVGWMVNLNGILHGDVSVKGGQVFLWWTIQWDANLFVDVLSFSSWAYISWDLVYAISNEAQSVSHISGFVAGKITKKDFTNFGPFWENEHQDSTFAIEMNWYGFFFLIVFWFLMYYAFPKYIKGVVQTISKKPWLMFFRGFLVFIVTPIIIILFLASVLAAPVGLFLMCLYIFLRVFLKLFVVVFWAGYIKKLSAEKTKKYIAYREIGAIVVLSLVVSLLPFWFTFVLWLFVVWATCTKDLQIIKKTSV